MSKVTTKDQKRVRRGAKSRFRIKSGDRHRICVNRSHQHIYVQLTDAKGSQVLASASTVEKEIRDQLSGSKSDKAKLIGLKIAERALALDIKQVAFDRSGFNYHGRVKALAEGAREGGLDF